MVEEVAEPGVVVLHVVHRIVADIVRRVVLRVVQGALVEPVVQ